MPKVRIRPGYKWLLAKSKVRESRRRKRRGRRIAIRIDIHDHHYYDKITVRRHHLSFGYGGIYIQLVVKRAKTKFMGNLEAVDGPRVATEGQVPICSRNVAAGYHLVFGEVSEGAFALN